jgi:hypothetical protein
MESDEMKFEWFSIKNIPYEKMWDSDKIWLEKIIQGEINNYDYFLDKK